MADAEQYDSSAASSLASQNANQTAKAADDQKEAQEKGKEGAAKATQAHKDKQSPKAPASGKPAGASASSNGGGLIGAIKRDINPAKPMPNAGASVGSAASPAAPVAGGMVPGGNSMVPVDSPKGQALTQDPKANLASKGRFSDYRKVFSQRGIAGKHSWGSK